MTDNAIACVSKKMQQIKLFFFQKFSNEEQQITKKCFGLLQTINGTVKVTLRKYVKVLQKIGALSRISDYLNDYEKTSF